MLRRPLLVPHTFLRCEAAPERPPARVGCTLPQPPPPPPLWPFTLLTPLCTFLLCTCCSYGRRSCTPLWTCCMPAVPQPLARAHAAPHAPAPPPEPPLVLPAVPRLVAIGDLHGDLAQGAACLPGWLVSWTNRTIGRGAPPPRCRWAAAGVARGRAAAGSRGEAGLPVCTPPFAQHPFVTVPARSPGGRRAGPRGSRAGAAVLAGAAAPSGVCVRLRRSTCTSAVSQSRRGIRCSRLQVAPCGHYPGLPASRGCSAPLNAGGSRGRRAARAKRQPRDDERGLAV